MSAPKVEWRVGGSGARQGIVHDFNGAVEDVNYDNQQLRSLSLRAGRRWSRFLQVEKVDLDFEVCRRL